MQKTSSSSITVKILRWVARILGTTLAVLFLTLVIGEIIEKGELSIPDPGNRVMMAFFLLAQAGLLIAWRWEGFGGFLAAASIIITILLRLFWVQGAEGRDPIVAFLIWLIPAFLFIYCWWRTSKKPSVETSQPREA